MRTRACRQRLRNSEVTASSLLTTIFKQTSRVLQYRIYPLYSWYGFPPVTKRHRGLLACRVISLSHQFNAIKIVNKFIQIHNSVANNLFNLLADKSIELLMVWKIIEGLYHSNILIKDSTHIVTKENNYISTLVFRKMDEIATTFVYYAYNEMALTKHNNHYYNHSETQYLYAN